MPGGSPVLFVKKRGTSELRLCVDYRKINSIMEPNCYPLLCIGDLLESLRSVEIFTKRDLRGAYNLIRVREADEQKTTFCIRYGSFEYLVLPFWLESWTVTFQAFINHVLGGLVDQFVISYLDDLLIYSESMEHRMQQVTEVQQMLRELYVKLETCQFHLTEVEFLGCRIMPEEKHVDPATVQSVVSWQDPQIKKYLKRFWGFMNYYHKFMSGYSRLTAPFTDCLRRKRPSSGQ